MSLIHKYNTAALYITHDLAVVAQVADRIKVLRHGKGDVGKRLASWLGRDDTALKFTLSMFADMRSQLAIDYPLVSVAVRRLAQLA